MRNIKYGEAGVISMDEDVKNEFKAVYKRILKQGNNISKIIGVEKELFAKIEKLEREIRHLRLEIKRIR